MSATQKHLIRDYFRRYAWIYAIGIILHLLVSIGLTYQSEIPLAGLIAGSAMVLGIDLIRSGNTMTRTMLAMPLTASQLANAWRFIALILPTIVFFLVLLVGVSIGTAIGGDKVSLHGFIVLALLQTGLLGLLFFALTGLQASPAQSTTFGETLANVFFAMLWGLSIPVVIFSPQLQVGGGNNLTPAHTFAWVFLLFATIAGWFRAETLVARRTVRPTAKAKTTRSVNNEDNRSWCRFGGLRYFMAHFGTTTLAFFVIMVMITWFGTNLFFGFRGPQKDGSMDMMQLHMFVAIAGLISMFQFLPMLRTLRTMPLRQRFLTNFLVLWPLFLILLFSVVGYSLHALVSGQEFLSSSYGICIGRSLAGGAVIILSLPLFLRFGLSIKSVFVMMFLISLSNTFGMLLDKEWKLAAPYQWAMIGIILATALPLTWFLTYKVLGTEHPWRAKQFRFGCLQRAT